MNNLINIIGTKSGGCAALIHPTSWQINKWVGWISDYDSLLQSMPVATASYVEAYRTTWDFEGEAL